MVQDNTKVSVNVELPQEVVHNLSNGVIFNYLE